MNNGFTTYPLTGPQNTTYFQRLVSFHKQTNQIPTNIRLDRKLDRELLAKAMEVEIQRNDGLRLRLQKKKGKVEQFFIDAYPVKEVEFKDFTGKTEEEMETYLNQVAQTVVPWFKKQPWRLIHFRMPNGNDGLSFTVCHLSMDTAGAMIFYRDLLNVYHAMESGAEMPEPMASTEQTVIQTLEKETNQKAKQRHEAFFKEYFGKHGAPVYAGADHGRELAKARKKKPERSAIFTFATLLHDKADLDIYSIDAETLSKIDSFAKERGIPFQNIMLLGLRTWLSKINNECEDVTIGVNIDRRSKLDELNSCGCRVMGAPFRTVLPGSMTFMEALNEISENMYQFMRHSDLDSLSITNIANEQNKDRLYGGFMSMIFSCFPPGALSMPKPWKVKICGANPGYFTQPMYPLMIPNEETGTMDCNYWYLSYQIKKEEVKQVHDNMLRTIEAGIANPELTLKEIMDKLHD